MSGLEKKEMILKETKGLSLEALSKVLDFIQFLKTKELKKAGKEPFEESLTDDLKELQKTSLTHLEEEFANYEVMYPYEQ